MVIIKFLVLLILFLFYILSPSLFFTLYIYPVGIVDALTAGQTSMVVVVMGTIKFLVKNPKVVPYTETFVLTSEPSTGGAVVWKIAKDSFRLLE